MLRAEPRPRPLPAVGVPRRRQHRAWGPAWPLYALLVLYPLWWAIGLSQFAFVLFAVPMAWRLRRRRPLKLPPAFGWWMLYLLWVLLSLVMLPATAPGTTSGSVGGRTLSVLVNLAELAGVTVMLLFVGNLSSAELPQRRLLKWLSVLFLVTVAGGVIGMAVPRLAFTSPLEVVLPGWISSNAYASQFLHPAVSQLQGSGARPSAPWAYTNFWGNNISLLLVWFGIYQWQAPASRRRTRRLVVGVGLALVTIVYSLNRGVWLGVLLSAGFVVWHIWRRGDSRAIVATLVAIPVLLLAFFVTPLHGVVSNRTHSSTTNSNSIRGFLDKAAVDGALESPVLGWGNTRKAIGSAQSVAIGPSPQCPKCGGVSIGSTGQLWAVMFSQGLVGLALYVGFFVMTLWRLRRDTSLIGSGSRLVVVLSVFYLFFYDNLPAALGLTMISIAMSWRQVQDAPVAAPVDRPEPRALPHRGALVPEAL
jgi:hypothetical protein